MTDDPDMPGSSPEEQNEAETHAQFAKLADLARKSTEDHIENFVKGSVAPLLDPYNLHFAVLCGIVSGVVTTLVGMGDIADDDPAVQAGQLSVLVNQMAGVFNEIQERKAAQGKVH